MHYMILNSIINITERKINNYKNCNCIYYKYSIERLHACTIQFTFYNVKAFHTMFDLRNIQKIRIERVGKQNDSISGSYLIL